MKILKPPTTLLVKIGNGFEHTYHRSVVLELRDCVCRANEMRVIESLSQRNHNYVRYFPTEIWIHKDDALIQPKAQNLLMKTRWRKNPGGKIVLWFGPDRACWRMRPVFSIGQCYPTWLIFCFNNYFRHSTKDVTFTVVNIKYCLAISFHLFWQRPHPTQTSEIDIFQSSLSIDILRWSISQ